MNNFTQKLKIILSDKSLRNKILFTLGALVIFRALAAIPIPGINTLRLQQFLANNQFFGVLNVFSGGGLSNLSVVMLGVGPYITGSIIMQLLTIMVPKLKALYQEEGEAGRKKFTMYSRFITVPLAIVQGFSLLTLLKNGGVLSNLTAFDQIINILIVTAGSMLIMWIGELITEYGIGNGVSLIIFAGIISRIPRSIGQLSFTFDASQIPVYAAFLIAAVAIIAAVVYVTEAERPIPVTYAKTTRGTTVTGGGVSTYIPLRMNQAGVMPIIFALSILLFPQMLSGIMSASSIGFIAKIGGFLALFAKGGLIYGICYFLLVFLFTYFYTAITFDPESMSNNLQKNGAFIPGVRPGPATAEHVSAILTKITLVGGVFLGLIAILPLLMQSITGVKTLAIGGTALLIVVSVVIDLVKKIDAQIAMREY